MKPASAAPKIGPTQKSQSCATAQPPTKSAGAVLRAGIGGPEDDEEEHEGHHDFADEGGAESVATQNEPESPNELGDKLSNHVEVASLESDEEDRMKREIPSRRPGRVARSIISTERAGGSKMSIVVGCNESRVGIRYRVDDLVPTNALR